MNTAVLKVTLSRTGNQCECREDRRDVVVTTSAGNQASRRVLYRLKATEVHVGNAGKKRVTVVQATTRKRMDKSTCRIRH